jgi:hypothetical protein
MIRPLCSVVILAVVLAASPALAQFRAETQLDALYDDNIFNSSTNIADKILLGSLGLGFDFDTEKSYTQLYYRGVFSYFTTVTERTFSYHSTGLEYSRLFGETERTLLTAGALYNLRANRDAYSYYDFGQLGFYGNIRHDFTDAVRIRIGYNFRMFDFHELQEFNYLEHYGFAQLTFMLPTRTTLILEADLGSKAYSNALVQVDSSGMGMGPRSVTESRIVPRVVQFVGIVRIGQSLTETTGFSATGMVLRDLEKINHYLSSNYGYISDDEVFDDHYAYEGYQLDLVLTQMITDNTSVKALAGFQERQYPGWTVTDVAGTIIAEDRLDRRKAISLRLSHYLEALDAELYLDYLRIFNDSNDWYFSYTNTALSIGLSVPLR